MMLLHDLWRECKSECKYDHQRQLKRLLRVAMEGIMRIPLLLKILAVAADNFPTRPRRRPKTRPKEGNEELPKKEIRKLFKDFWVPPNIASFTPKLALEGSQIPPQTSLEGGGFIWLLYVLVSSQTEAV